MLITNKKMIKRGISPLIATVLLIGFTVAIAIFVINWGTTFIQTTQKDVEKSSAEQIKCSADVSFEISCKCTATDERINSCSYKVTNNEDSSLVVTTYRVYSADDTFIQSGEGPTNIGPFGVASSTISFSESINTNRVKLEVLATQVRSGGKLVECGNLAISSANCLIE